MKRFLVMLAIMAIAMAGVFAAEPATESTGGSGSFVATGSAWSDAGGSATLEVTLDLGPESPLGKYYEVGFTDTDVTDFSADDFYAEVRTFGKVTTVALDKITDTDDVENSDPVYVYWAIRATKGSKYNIGLSLPGNMTVGSDSTGINWSVTPGKGADSTTAITTTQAGGEVGKEDVKVVTANEKMVIGCFPITISTENLRSKTDIDYKNEYKTTLTLTVKGA